MVPKVTLSLQPVREVLGFLGDTNLGVAPRPVVCRILQLANIADAETLEKVASQWPELSYAWFVARRTPWGLDWLRGIAAADAAQSTAPARSRRHRRNIQTRLGSVKLRLRWCWRWLWSGSR